MDNLTQTGVKPLDSVPGVKSADPIPSVNVEINSAHDFRTHEPMAWQCKGCKQYSQYRIEYDNGEIPNDWEENDRGIFCGECKYD